MPNLIYNIIDQITLLRRRFIYRRFNFKNVTLGDVVVRGDYVTIGEGTYMNGGRIASAEKGKVRIGKWCAIGFNVHILAITHNPNFPTGPIDKRPIPMKDITIGNGVWIGSNVIILPGVKIGDYAIVGANAVVNSDVLDFQVVGGVPAKLLYTKDKEKCKEHIDFIEHA
jgi:acetyltransferase-like isoleucine patch superfamily enzyme